MWDVRYDGDGWVSGCECGRSESRVMIVVSDVG